MLTWRVSDGTAQRVLRLPECFCLQVVIREEQADDAAEIREVNDKAFGQPLEGNLVDLLRANGGILLSLVALSDAQIVGHILFSPVSLGLDGEVLQGAGLGPMAVLPEFQQKNIGTQLVSEGIDRLRKRGCPFVVVLGHPEYYPRCGFVPASRYNVRCEWEVPNEAFMLLRLSNCEVSGLAKYREEFSSVT
jgi:putative acetyltransferase